MAEVLAASDSANILEPPPLLPELGCPGCVCPVFCKGSPSTFDGRISTAVLVGVTVGVVTALGVGVGDISVGVGVGGISVGVGVGGVTVGVGVGGVSVGVGVG